jgi:hypothetical protein
VLAQLQPHKAQKLNFGADYPDEKSRNKLKVQFLTKISQIVAFLQQAGAL